MMRKTQQEYDELRNIALHFDFDDFLKLPTANNTTPGQLTMTFTKVPETLTDIMVGPEKERKVKLTMMVSTDLKQCECDVGEPFYSGLDFLPDGRLVAVDNKNDKCLVFNQNLEKTRIFKMTIHPQAVVGVSEEEVVITSGRTQQKLVVLKISKQNKFTVARECKVTNFYESIIVIDDGSLLAGCFDDTQPVRVVSPRGEEKELGIQFPTKAYPQDSSVCTYIKSRNMVVLSDRLAHTVYIYDIAHNTRVEIEDKLIKEPHGVAAGPDDSIFVCIRKTNSIVQLSHTRQILSSHVLDMWYPCSVGVSKDNTRLAVSNGAVGKQRLQLYKIELI